MPVYLREGSTQKIVSAATLRQKLQIRCLPHPGYSILALGQPVEAVTLQRQAPGRVATGAPMFKSVVCGGGGEDDDSANNGDGCCGG